MTQLRCGVIFRPICHVTNFPQRLTECASERNFKIGQHLTKIWTKIWWHVFFDSRCMLHSNRNTVLIVVLVWTEYDVMQKIMNFGHPEEELIFR